MLPDIRAAFESEMPLHFARIIGLNVSGLTWQD